MLRWRVTGRIQVHEVVSVGFDDFVDIECLEIELAKNYLCSR